MRLGKKAGVGVQWDCLLSREHLKAFSIKLVPFLRVTLDADIDVLLGRPSQ